MPPLVAIETAERLLRNHRNDENTRQLLRTLDIWIAPSINPDGGHYSFYDFASQRRNMTNHCAAGGATDALARNSWGVDNNRNYTVALGQAFDAFLKARVALPLLWLQSLFAALARWFERRSHGEWLGRTVRLVDGLVQVNALGPIPVKELTEPVEVFELVVASAVRQQAVVGDDCADPCENGVGGMP